MMRQYLLGITAVALLTFVTSAAHAVLDLSISTAADTSALEVGDTFIVDLFANNPDGDAVQQIFTTLSTNSSVVEVQSAQNLPSILGNPLDPFAPSLAQIGTSGDQKAGQPAGLLIGLAYGSTGGAATGPGGLAARVTFVAVGAGSFDLTHLIQGFDETIVNGETNAGLSFGSPIAVTVIPEPTTALLMGLGLAGLAAAGRRE